MYIDGLPVAFWRVMGIVLGCWIQVDWSLSSHECALFIQLSDADSSRRPRELYQGTYRTTHIVPTSKYRLLFQSLP